jgi:signal transduction histidine kinase
MDDIVWSINPNNDSMFKMIARVREYAAVAFEENGIQFVFNVDPAVYNIICDMHIRRDIFLISKESISVIAKHSRATLVKLDFKKVEHALIITLEDNGLGFDVDAYGQGESAFSLRKRAKMMQAVISIQAVPDKGTFRYLEVPIT